ncbi:MAG: histidinol-phosphate transaminase [Blastocatellia bacterium]|jgi:histidinol-phosphate aminotransferase
MSSPLENIKPGVRALTAYTLNPIEAAVKINQNENPFGLPTAIRDEIVRRALAVDWARYPEFVPRQLLDKLAKYTGWRADGIMAGNGSNEMIQSVVQATIEKGRRVVLPEPTFSVYRQVISVAGGEIIPVLLTPSLEFDLPAIREAVITHRPTLTIICSPNNPTGCTITSKELTGLLECSSGLVVVDQAYVEIGGEDFVPLLSSHPNLIILRTFSKAMALGGLRIGYCLASPALTTELSKARMPYSLNLISMIAAEVTLEREAELKPLVTAMAAEKSRLLAALAKIPGLAPVPSAANFLVTATSIPPPQLFTELLGRGFLIRDISQAPLLSNYVRISVGTPAENTGLIEALTAIFTKR